MTLPRRLPTPRADPGGTVAARAGDGCAGDGALEATGILALAGIGIIHFVQIVPTFEQTPLLGVGYVAVIAATLAVGARLLHCPSNRDWALAAAISAAIIVGYVFTRAASTPLDNQDVGNWDQSLGLASLFVEASLLALSVYAIAARRSAAPGRALPSDHHPAT